MKSLIFLSWLVAQSALGVNRESGGAGGNLKLAAAVFVSFKSLGNGIDSTTLQLTEKLTKQAISEGMIKEMVTTPWGHEGEVTICVHFQGGPFNGVGPSREFVKTLAPSILKDTQPRTDVFIGLSCDDITKATKQDLAKYLSKTRMPPQEVPLADKIAFKNAMVAFVQKHSSSESAIGCELKIREQSSFSRYFFELQDLSNHESSEFALIIKDAQKDHTMSTIVMYRGNAHSEIDKLSITKNPANLKTVLYEHIFDGYFDDVIQLRTIDGGATQKHKFDYAKYLGDKIMGIHCEMAE